MTVQDNKIKPGIFPGEGIIVQPDKNLGIFISRDLSCSHTLKPVPLEWNDCTIEIIGFLSIVRLPCLPRQGLAEG
jgi:hypothetical protein